MELVVLFRTSAVVLRNTIVSEWSNCIYDLFRGHVSFGIPATVHCLLSVFNLPWLQEPVAHECEYVVGFFDVASSLCCR